MENDKILELYINKINDDQKALKDDMVTSEKRIFEQIAASEKRTDAHFNEIKEMFQSQNNHIVSLEKELTGKIEKTTDHMVSLEKEIYAKLEDNRKYTFANTITIIIAAISMVLTLVGIYYSTISTITDVLSLPLAK